MPFGKDLAPGMLHGHDAHAQAVARIQWCISEQAIGVISGECGAGKTVAARAAVAGLDASRHTVLYLGTPGVGLRGIYGMIVTRLGGSPKFHHAALIPQAQELLAAEHAERRWSSSAMRTTCWTRSRWKGSGACRTWGWTRPPRSAFCC